MTILQGNKRFVESQFEKEDELVELVRSQSKFLFGEATIFVPKLKLKGLVLGNTIPDGFLFDLTDLENPEFYLVEFELQRHDFHRHMLSQITKFMDFFRSSASQDEFVEDLFSIVKADTALKREFKRRLGDDEIFKFLKDICQDSHKVLVVIDGENAQLSKQISNSKDWKSVKILTVKAFRNKSETLVAVEPDFVDIRNTPDEEDLETGTKPLTTGQRAMIAAEMSMRPNSNISVSKAAKHINTGRGNVHIAKKIKLASPALAKLVQSGKLSLHRAEMRITTPKKVISK
jgi:hypothetical protein